MSLENSLLPSYQPPTSEDITVGQVLKVFRRRRSLILITTLFVFCCGILLCVVMKRQYKASAQIQVGNQSSDALGLDSLKGETAAVSDALEENISLQTQVSILQSDTLALKAITDLDLEATPEFRHRPSLVARLLSLVSPPAPSDPQGASLDDSPLRRTGALATFHRHLSVKAVGGTRLIEITYTSADPRTAAAVVNEMTRSLEDYTFQTRLTATTEASQWLSGQMSDLKQQAEGLQAKVTELQREAGVYSLGNADGTGKELAYSATLDRLQQATQAVTQATTDRIVKQGIYEMVRSGDPETISGLAGATVAGTSAGVSNSFNLLQTLRGQQATIETQMAADTSKYGSSNPKLQDDRAALQGVNDALGNEVHRIGERAERDFHAAQLTEARTKAVYDNEKAAANQLNDKAIEYSIAKQEANQSRSLYETLYQHLKAAGVIEGLRSSNITIVDPGRVPAKPSEPNPLLYLAASLIGGLVLGAVSALVADNLDSRIQDVAELEHSLAAPLMGVVPRLNLPRSRQSGDAPGEPLLLGGPSYVQPTDLRTTTQVASNLPFLEALRSLRTNLLLSRSASPVKVILITSAAEGEGKSTLAVHLAAMLATNRSRVLLVEADMRCPVLSRLLPIPTDQGLSSLLSGVTDENCIQTFDSLAGLSVLPSGPKPPFPAELLGSETMENLLKRWETEFDFIVLDSPSVLAVTDATILSRLADITLLITRHSYSTRKSLQRARAILRQGGQTRVGVVLNALKRESPAYDEYFGYQGTRYYGGSKPRARQVSSLVVLLFTLVSLSVSALGQNSLLLTAGDLIHIQVADTPEMSSDARVADDGMVPVVGIGDVKVAGLTPSQAASAVRSRLIETHYLNHPDVSISVLEAATMQVSVIGEVKNSGAFTVSTPRPILDVLALAGGLTPEANRHIVIEHKTPTPHTTEYFVSNDSLQAIRQQVMVAPGDTVVVPRAGIVYVIGDVNRPGGFVMSNNESQLTLLQAVALAGGMARSAKEKHAHLLRREPEGGFTDVDLSLGDIEKGRRADMALHAGDILYVPFSFGRNLAVTGSASVATAAAGAAIYAIP